MKVALIASEAVPYSKTGGLADVTGSLFRQFRRLGIDASLFVPLYKKTRECWGPSLDNGGIAFDVPLGDHRETCRIYTAERTPGGPDAAFLIGHDGFFGRDELYGTAAGDYPDNARRFTFFCRAVLEACKRLDLRFDVMHANDWQTGLVPFYLKTLYRNEPVFHSTRTVFTIHNLGYQGLFPSSVLPETGLGREVFTPEGLEFFGKVNLLKAGIVAADVATTVSPTYAREILTPDKGFGLDGVLRSRPGGVRGILNGIDYDEWDAGSDAFLPARYTAADPGGKVACKRALMERFGLKGDDDTPLICFVGRISEQKGIDLLAEALDSIVDAGADCFILGKGDQALQKLLAERAAAHTGRVHLEIGFDEALAHLAYAGSDIFLMPSVYEPCGLGQMIAMRYGTIPVAFATGGLVDTIASPESPELFFAAAAPQGSETGFLFSRRSKDALLDALGLALFAYSKPHIWRQLVENAMNRDFSWERSARRYLDIYAGGEPVL